MRGIYAFSCNLFHSELFSELPVRIMCHQRVFICALIGVLLAVIQTGDALQCWKCTSEFDMTCRDYFNVTRIQQNRRYFDDGNYGNRQQQPARTDPHLEHCDEMFTSTYGQKNVCLKRVQTANSGLKVVSRECRLVSNNLKSGECPPELYERNKNIDFCQTCDYDGCNSATGLKTSIVASLIPVSLLLFFRK